MTDTTDIKALREKYTLALKDLTERLVECNRLNYCGDELSAFAAFSSTVIDQLEAERQRADSAERDYLNEVDARTGLPCGMATEGRNHSAERRSGAGGIN